MNHDQQIEALKSQSSVLKVERDKVNCPVVWVKCDGLIDLLRFLKNTEGFEYRFLADLTAYDDFDTDEADAGGRFVMVYNLFSPQHKQRLRVKARIDENQEVPTAVKLWDAANWAEREVFDLFGIRFKAHPDLRRILMDERWKGHPLRKDYNIRYRQIFTDAEKMPEHLLKEDLHGH